MGIQINGQTDTISAVDNNFSLAGNVSIGGTLTYEDVTSVDAVGLSTFKAGIQLDDSIAHLGDTDTKIRFPAVNTVTVETAGSERLRIDSNGYVDIQTGILGDNPSDNFTLNGRTQPHYGFNLVPETGVPIGIAGYRGIAFASSGTERMRISEGGSVGIGTNNPGDKLSIYTAPNALVFGAKDTTRGNHIFQLLANNPAGDGELRLYKSSASGTHEKTVEIKSTGNSYFTGGNLLVNTTTSRSVMDHVGNGPTPKIQIEATNSDAIMSIISAGTSDANRCGTINLGRHRNGTVGATPTIVNDNDALGAVVFSGGDGGDMLTAAAKIHAEVDGTPGANDMPGALVFSTTPDGQGHANNTERFRIDSSGRIKIGPIADQTSTTTHCPVYIDVHSDITAFNTAEGGSNTGLIRIEETGSNANRYHGIEFRNRQSGDIRIMNLDVNTSDRGDLVIAMPDQEASAGLHYKARFNSLKSSLQIAGKGGASLSNSATEHVDVYIATKTQVTGVGSGAGAEIAGVIRFEDKGATNSRYHGLELRNRNSGDARILNLDEGVTNKSNMVFGVDDGSNLIEAMKLHSSGYVTTPQQPSFSCYKNGHFNFTSNTNTTIKPWTEQHDTHSDFNATTGVFTAPVAGKYFFYITVMQQRQGNGDFQLKIYKNGALYVMSNDMSDAATTTFQQTTINAVISLAANDTASFVTRNSTDTSSFLYSGQYTHCGGYLIG